MANYAAAAPRGTLAPGTIVKIGEYTVKVDRFLSEGTPSSSPAPQLLVASS